MHQNCSPIQDYIVQTELDVVAASVPYLKQMPLPQTASLNFTLQVPLLAVFAARAFLSVLLVMFSLCKTDIQVRHSQPTKCEIATCDVFAGVQQHVLVL